MSDLWADKREEARRSVEPLAVRMRPRTLAEFAGQSHILGEGKLLRRMLKADAITSLILFGPPGTGKTTLASLIALHTKRHFVGENAASVGVKRIREIIDDAEQRLHTRNQRTILFLDEIHRFTRSQQDVLLADVERGTITFIGATTENPLFSVNSALVSRSTLFRLEALTNDEVKGVLRRAISDPERGFGKFTLEVSEQALDVWAIKSDGDARRALNALEIAVLSSLTEHTGGPASGSIPGTGLGDRGLGDRVDALLARPPGEPAGRPRSTPPEARGTQGAQGKPQPLTIVIDRAVAEDSIQQKAAVYDGSGDDHYDAASALIKSIRGGDPDAGVYWIARMLEAGEDPRFIARRLAILASEDIGNADPRALLVATAAWEMVERVGMPECRITLGHCACFLALCPKSNAAYTAIEEALADVREGRTVPVPIHIKDGNVRKATQMSAGGKSLGARNGADPAPYEYSHMNPDAIGTQDYLGVDKEYYRPTLRGMEKELSERLDKYRAARRTRRASEHTQAPSPAPSPPTPNPTLTNSPPSPDA
jgi:putative ATPase